MASRAEHKPMSDYLREVQAAYSQGTDTEHTHRPALKKLIETLSPGVTATNEPRRVECGAPDYVVSLNTQHGPLTIGYVEAKNIGVSLDEATKSEQLRRYLSALPNFILTDYLEFRWFVDGHLRASARLAQVGSTRKLNVRKQGIADVERLLRDFLNQQPASVSNPSELAKRMARLTHMIRDMIVKVFSQNKASDMLTDLRRAFAKTLIPDLEEPSKTAEFADMYAQTIAYGLFAAWCNHSGGPFKRVGAAAEIPKTNPFLRKLFETVTGTELDNEPYAGFVDDLASLLTHADKDSILAHFGQHDRRKDPIFHFYETFLAAYDPKLREVRGVYYTPEPVVSYIVRSVDYLLRERFGCSNGLADTTRVSYSVREHGEIRKAESPRVLILDPACGTGTFLYAVVDHIREQIRQQRNAGSWSSYVREHLLPRLFGFELLMAPYAVAHFKLGMQLAAQDLAPAEQQQWAYDFSGNERLGVYLTNTLEQAEHNVETLFGPLRVITEEANAAAKVKSELPIMVVLGNPPYSGHSANRSWIVKDGRKVPSFIGGLVRDYYQVDGQPMNEKNPKWLQDDYVKFIRWAHWRIEQTGSGILAFITNHGYLDNPTFRGMRRSLMNAFDEIYVLDLHGNSKKKERAPDGGKDENVFDIQQGVAIGIYVRKPDHAGPAKVYHKDMYGLRVAKYEALYAEDVSTSDFNELMPTPPHYRFAPEDADLRNEYEGGVSISDIFKICSVGIVTARDELTVKYSPEEIKKTVQRFRSLTPESAREEFGLGPDVRDWKIELAQKDIADHGEASDLFVPMLYRPFDIRYTYYTGRSRGFHCMPRPAVMKHLVNRHNLALVLPKRIETPHEWRNVFASSTVVEHVAVSAKTIDYVMPLLTYEDVSSEPSSQMGLLTDHSTARKYNLNTAVISSLADRLSLRFLPDGKGDLESTFGPEDVFDYIYAILYCPTYRSRYAEFLRIDFPRIPLTSDVELFRRLCTLGSELVALHVMESPLLENPSVNYPVSGNHVIGPGHPKYLAPGEPEPRTGAPLAQGRVYINETQYFEGVEPEVWNFHIGGYHVCERWLKDRQGRAINDFSDQLHYRKVVVALRETIRLMYEINKAVPHWPVT